MEYEEDYFDAFTKYNDDYIFFEYLIIFVALKLGKEVYYKHQYISFFILILFENIKNIYFDIKKLYKKINIISFVLSIINSILYTVLYLYIKGLMKYKYTSPYMCNFMIGVINVPIIILMSFIISYTPLGNDKSEYHYDNIFAIFKDLGKIDIKSAIILKLYFFDYKERIFIILNISESYLYLKF